MFVFTFELPKSPVDVLEPPKRPPPVFVVLDPKSPPEVLLVVFAAVDPKSPPPVLEVLDVEAPKRPPPVEVEPVVVRVPVPVPKRPPLCGLFWLAVFVEDPKRPVEGVVVEAPKREGVVEVFDAPNRPDPPVFVLAGVDVLVFALVLPKSPPAGVDVVVGVELPNRPLPVLALAVVVVLVLLPKSPPVAGVFPAFPNKDPEVVILQRFFRYRWSPC